MRRIIFLVPLDLSRAPPRHERGRMPGVPRLCSPSLSSAPGFCISWFMGSPLYFSSLLMSEVERSWQKCIFRASENVKETSPPNSALWVVLFFWVLTASERRARWLTCIQLIIAAWSRVQIKSFHHHYLREQDRAGWLSARRKSVLTACWHTHWRGWRRSMMFNVNQGQLRVTVSDQSITTTNINHNKWKNIKKQ